MERREVDNLMILYRKRDNSTEEKISTLVRGDLLIMWEKEEVEKGELFIQWSKHYGGNREK